MMESRRPYSRLFHRQKVKNKNMNAQRSAERNGYAGQKHKIIAGESTGFSSRIGKNIDRIGLVSA